MSRAVAYYRVSTEFQRESGYSLGAQRTMVRRHLETTGAELVAEFEEAESAYRPARVTLDHRPALRAALTLCRRQKATLVIAALDRLARNVVFVATLLETKVPFLALDLPGATPFIIQIYAAMAEEESRQRGAIVRAALALAKQTGACPNFSGFRKAAEVRARAEKTRSVIERLRRRGIVGVQPTMKALNRNGVACPGHSAWTVGITQRTLLALGYKERAAAPSNKLEADARARILLPLVARLRARGKTMAEVAINLNRRGFRSGRGVPWTKRSLWDFVKYRNLLARRRNQPATLA